MRDITVYPITPDEVVCCVRQAASEMSYEATGCIGGINGLALFYLTNFLEQPEIQVKLQDFLTTAQPQRTST